MCFRCQTAYDFSNVSPIAVNSTLVSSFGGDFVVDCLFIDPFTIGQELNSSKPKGFETNVSKKKQNIRIKVMPMARLMISPHSAIMLMKQIQNTLDQLGIQYNDKDEKQGDEIDVETAT
jgi:hypothetical protein